MLRRRQPNQPTHQRSAAATACVCLASQKEHGICSARSEQAQRGDPQRRSPLSLSLRPGCRLTRSASASRLCLLGGKLARAPVEGRGVLAQIIAAHLFSAGGGKDPPAVSDRPPRGRPLLGISATRNFRDSEFPRLGTL